jgi:hypothetical protein
MSTPITKISPDVLSWGASCGNFCFVLASDNTIRIAEKDVIKPKTYGTYNPDDTFSIYTRSASAIQDSFSKPSVIIVYCCNGVKKYSTEPYLVEDLPELGIFVSLGSSLSTKLRNVAWVQSDGTANQVKPIEWSKQYRSAIKFKDSGKNIICMREPLPAEDSAITTSSVRSAVNEKVQPTSTLFCGLTFTVLAPSNPKEECTFLVGLVDFQKTPFDLLEFPQIVKDRTAKRKEQNEKNKKKRGGGGGCVLL